MPDNYAININQNALLHDWQNDFASRLFQDQINGNHRDSDVDGAGRMAIYRNNVFASLMTAMEETFPVIRQLVGDTCFRFLAYQYVRENQPESVVLANYGETFAEFLASQVSLEELPYLPDMARFERLYIETYHAADHLSMDQASLAMLLTHPDLLPISAVSFHPSFHLFKSSYSIVSLWLFHQAEFPSEMIPIQTPETAFFSRVQGQVMVVKLSELDNQAIEMLRMGYSLGEVVERIIEQDNNWLIEALLKKLFYYQCITSISPHKI